ncbi:MAG: hypothetical protein ACP5P6_01570 [Candidatus Saccharicenans sp.]
MGIGDWLNEFDGAIIVADEEGKILYLNEKAARNYEQDGGFKLLGQNLFHCHKAQSKEKIKAIMNENRANVYTIEKKGIKKLIYQAPWVSQGQVRGIIELSLEIPFDLPHFVRD